MIEFKKIIISDYRAIKKAEINLNNSISPIIGVNEAGKTTVLKAILCLDKRRDKLNDGEHLNFLNIYSRQNKAIISVEIIIKEDDFFKQLIAKCKVKTNSEDYNILSKLSKYISFKLSRHLGEDGRVYSLEGGGIEQLSQQIAHKTIDFFVSKTPYILYFDDFNDRVPDKISFDKNYKEDGKLLKKNREWKETIEELFKRANPEFITGKNKKMLQEYFSMTDNDAKSDVLNDVKDELNKEIVEEWKKIKESGFDGSQSIDIEIDLINIPNTQDFSFKVIDKSSSGKSRTFSISARSKGFQWFFNYMLKLKFNSNYTNTLENCLFLLDEPGSYLHSSAQSELLKELKRVSENNKIIFCTHSQFLLNPDIISLGSVKIAEKENGSIINIFDYGNYPSSGKTGALAPIHAALNLNPTYDFIGKVVIVEGITDYYFLKILQNKGKITNKIKVIPSSGAGNSSILISIAFGFSDNFILILDNDSAGIEAKNKYIKEFGENLEEKIHFYSKLKLEKLMSKTVQDKLLEITKSNKVKKALGIIIFSRNIDDFISSFDNETNNNIINTLNIINDL
jgi:predicted ATP-dependent endonuclease of OLD family